MANKLNILIVDDEESLRCSLGSILEVHGYSVSMVGDGLKAIEEIKKGKFDVIFLDIKMPRMNGVEVLREIKKIDKKIIVIIMTAYALIDLIEEAQKEAFLFIDKPFDIPSIFEILEKICPREEFGKRKVAIVSKNLDSFTILQDAGYDVSSFDNIDTFLRSAPESFRSVLIEPVSEDTVNDFRQKLKEQKLNLKLISIVNFDSPILPFLKKENLVFLRKHFNKEDLLKKI